MTFGYHGPRIDLAAEAEVHFPCDQCSESTHEDDLFPVGDEQICRDCCDERAEAQAEDRAELFHGGDLPFTLDEKFAAARQLDADLKAGRR